MKTHGLLTTLLALAATAPAFGQTVDPGQFVQLADRAARMADQNLPGQLWDEASPVMKKSSPRETFISEVITQRQSTGQLTYREWISVSRTKLNSGTQQLPAGEYLTVNFLTKSNSTKSYHEQVSFIKDPDNTWRIIGYSIK